MALSLTEVVIEPNQVEPTELARATSAIVTLWEERGYWDTAPNTCSDLGEQYSLRLVEGACREAKRQIAGSPLPDWPTFRARRAGEPPKWTDYYGKEPEWRRQQERWYLECTGKKLLTDGATRTKAWKKAINKFNQKPADPNAIANTNSDHIELFLEGAWLPWHAEPEQRQRLRGG